MSKRQRHRTRESDSKVQSKNLVDTCNSHIYAPLCWQRWLIHWNEPFLVAVTQLFTLPCWSVGPLRNFLKSERLFHYGPCPIVCDCCCVSGLVVRQLPLLNGTEVVKFSQHIVLSERIGDWWSDTYDFWVWTTMIILSVDNNVNYECGQRPD